MKTFLSLCALLLLGVAGCHADDRKTSASREEGENPVHPFKITLLNTIERSDQIIVSDHSYMLDYRDRGTNKALISREIVYETRHLDKQQKRAFAQVVKELSDKNQSNFSLCIFQPHHRMEFYSNKNLLSTLEVCFKCKQLAWNGSQVTPPDALFGALAGFLKLIGLEPVRDWEALAKEHSDVSQRSN